MKNRITIKYSKKSYFKTKHAPAKNALKQRYFDAFEFSYFIRKKSEYMKDIIPYRTAQEYGKWKLKMLVENIPTAAVKIAAAKLKNFDKNSFESK